MSKEIYIKVSKNGPYLVYGHPKMNEQHIITDNEGVSIQYSDGEIYHIKEEPAALCRCGQSEHAPFCDGTHEYESWDGTEEASFD